MSNNLRSQIFSNLNIKETDELLEIWTTNDRVEWSNTAFDVIKEILEQRLGELPPQDEPIFEYVEREVDNTYDENILIDKYNDPNDPPIFYKPKQVIWMNRWLNRLAVAAVGATIIISIPEFFRMHDIVLSYFRGNPEWNFVSWMIALVVGGLLITFQSFIIYFSLKALASILKILMEMEFNSRVTE
jgi:amino acid transporter